MLTEGDFHYQDGKRLVNEWAEGRVQTFIELSGRRYTEINVRGTIITVARAILPRIVPRPYGEIEIPVLGEGGQLEKVVFPIKRFLHESPQFVVESPDAILGGVQGPRLDLAIANGLGVTDEELLIDMKDTRIDPEIPEKIRETVVLGHIYF